MKNWTAHGSIMNVRDFKWGVLYLLHGGGEDESGWAKQGKTDLILDNLLADKKARPMVVMLDGNMGGLQTLYAGARNTDMFAYLGVFSSGFFANNPKLSDLKCGYPKTNAGTINQNLK